MAMYRQRSCMHAAASAQHQSAKMCPCGAEDAKPQLAASGVAAAWRLGRWEALDSYLQQSQAAAADALDSEQKWDMCIGQILADMHRRQGPILLSHDAVPQHAWPFHDSNPA